MKKFLSVNNTTPGTDLALLLARFGISTLILTHGIPKLLSLLSGEPIQFASVMGMSAAVSLCLAIFAEVVCSVFILVGFGTRFAAIPLIITMAVAVFTFHAADPFKVQEMALLYMLAFVVLLFAGSGKYSLDYLFTREIEVAKYRKEKVKGTSFSVYQ